MTKPVPTHYLRGNAAERSPKRLFVLDTETTWEDREDQRIHRLRLWCAERIDRTRKEGDPKRVKAYSGETIDSLLDAIEAEVRSNVTLWLYTHNLSFDLAVTQLPVRLVQNGWHLARHALASKGPWARLYRGSRRLVLADSTSILPTSIAKLGVGLGIEKPTLPDNGGSDVDWTKRCHVDVEVLRRSITGVLDWWDQHELGNWSITGSGCGWNAYRHKFPLWKVLIQPDDAARSFERGATYGGYQWIKHRGLCPRGPYAELDFSHAHLTVAREHPLPVRRLSSFSGLPIDTKWLDYPFLSIMARVRLRVASPRYPVRLAERVWYPSGELQTTLAGPEIREARDRGDLLEIGPGYYYELAPSMQSWGRWLSDLLDNPEHELPCAVYTMCKGWSRSVIGRWAVRHGISGGKWNSPFMGWKLDQGIDGATNRPMSLLHLGGQVEQIIQGGEGDNSFPAVLAWIQSWTRVYLLRAIEALGDAVVQANTDGMLVNLETVRRDNEDYWGPDLGNGQPHASIAEYLPTALLSSTAPLSLQAKRTGISAFTLSPQHIQFADERHFAGIPRAAESLDHFTYAFWTWPKLPTQINLTDEPAFVQLGRSVDLRGIAPAGWLMADHTVEPITLRINDQGENEIQPAYGLFFGTKGLAQRCMQHRALQEVLPVGWEPTQADQWRSGVSFGWPE